MVDFERINVSKSNFVERFLEKEKETDYMEECCEIKAKVHITESDSKGREYWITFSFNNKFWVEKFDASSGWTNEEIGIFMKNN